jgi:hypothetical protein
MAEKKQETISLKEYVDLKDKHIRELRDADKIALDLLAKNNALHFEQLNENAKRTIEERSHFVSREAFDPFERLVLKYIDENQGKVSGRSKDWGTIVSVATFLMALIYFGLKLAGR